MLLSVLSHCKLGAFASSAALSTEGIQIPDAHLNMG
jgi:hypothetical protein